MNNIVRALAKLFCPNKKQQSVRLVAPSSKKEKAVVAFDQLTPAQLATIAAEEEKMLQSARKLGLRFVSFHDFCINMMPEIAEKPFAYRLEVWKYNHTIETMAKRGSNIEFNNPDHFHGALVVAHIIHAAQKHVIMNVNPQSKEILSLDVCVSAIAHAQVRGVRVVQIPVKSFDRFSVWNDVGMTRHEKSTIDHSALVSFRKN